MCQLIRVMGPSCPPAARDFVTAFLNMLHAPCSLPGYTPEYALNPPSTGITIPVTNFDISDTR